MPEPPVTKNNRDDPDDDQMVQYWPGGRDDGPRWLWKSTREFCAFWAYSCCAGQEQEPRVFPALFYSDEGRKVGYHPGRKQPEIVISYTQLGHPELER